jgi:hypothetical protein
MVATIPTLVSQYATLESRLVTIENVTFIGDEKFVNGTDTLKYFDNFGNISNEPVSGEMGNIIGFLAIRDGQVQLYPRDDNDFVLQQMDQVATPVITADSTTYENELWCNQVLVSLSCATENATIYYAINEEEYSVYTGPFYVFPHPYLYIQTVSAYAVKEGMLNSEVVTESYCVLICDGIQDAQQQTVSIYPNPTASDVTLDLSGLNAKTVELFSMNGQLLSTVVPTDETMTLSLSQYANGIYFVRIHSDKGITTQKIVKK